MKFYKILLRIIVCSTLLVFLPLNIRGVKAAPTQNPEDIEWEKYPRGLTFATVDNLQYYYDTDGEYARIFGIDIMEGAEKPEVIVIPKELEGYMVVAIGNDGSRETEAYPFEMVSKGLKEIVVPDSVIKLYYGAFSHLPDLEKITLPNSIKELPDSLFSGCISLNEIILPDKLERVGEFTFSRTGITEITIPDTVNSLGKGAFHKCKALKKVTLPNTIKKLPKYAFSHCTNLVKINLENITSFSEYSLLGCAKLKTIKFNENLSYIGWCALNESKWMKERENKAFVVINKKFLVKYNGKSKKPTIPKGITHIVAGAFEGKELTSIEIPKTVTFIEASFSDTGIKSIYFAGNAPKIKMEENETISSYLGSKTKVYYKKGKTGFNTKQWKALNPKIYKTYP